MDIIIDDLKKGQQTLTIVKPGLTSANDLNSLLEYIASNKDALKKLLEKSGAIIFRGFDIKNREEFMKVKNLLADGADFNYVDGNSPRTKLSGNVYTSTEFPSEHTISLHNEMSYSSRWPSKLFFYCEIPAVDGGQTPIVDCRYILKELNQDMIHKFDTHGVKYTRYLSGKGGFGKTWMDTFETNDRLVVEDFCNTHKIDYSWDGDSLFISQLGPGIIEHPFTHEKAWFNQADQFHPSSLPVEVYEALNMMYDSDKGRFPHYAYYGNGEEISDDNLREITATLLDRSIKLKWEKGDVLMLDNILMAHGRMPFSGDRKIYVSMA